jgi:hypothetical protein
MNMPEMNIAFTSQGTLTVERSEKGSVFLILRGDAPESNPLTVLSAGDITKNVSEKNKEYIEMALKGNDTAPQKVVAFFIAEESGDVDEALSWAETNKLDFLAMPTVETDGLTDKIKKWVIEQKSQHNMIKAVLPNCEADSEYIVNFVTKSVIAGEREYTAEEMTARIAGMICGTSLEHSITYATVTEATDCERKTAAEMEVMAGAGKLFCFWDGEKVKLSRGINSLLTLTAEKGDEFKKIKHIEVMNSIESDIRTLCQDFYIGKFGNSYSNRCLLTSAISSYLDAYLSEGIIESAEVGFDLEAIKAAMKKANKSYDDMSDEEILQCDFGTGVYIAITLSLRDAIEDITVNITI